MRVVAPTELLRDAASVLAPVRDGVVLIGALAVQIALDGHDAPLAPTLDADVGSPAETANEVVASLEEAGLRRSEVPHERPFTWVGGGIKVQVVRPFHPHAKGAAAQLPVNNLIRDFSDVALLFDRLADTIVAELSNDQIRSRVVRAAERLRDEDLAVEAAARELQAVGEVANRREGEEAAQRAAREMLAELAAAGSA